MKKNNYKKNIFFQTGGYIHEKILYICYFLIKYYQCYISPLLGKHCRFYPTCSAYALQALEQKGFFYGFTLIIWRILRCNPLSRGGVDMISNSKEK